MADDVDEFFDDFDHYANEVSAARHQDFARILKQWFQTLEHAPEPLRSRLAWLREYLPAGQLEKEVIVQGRGMVGSGKLNWPDDLEYRLSGQLQLLDALTEKEDSAWQFAFGFFPGGGNNINATLNQLVEHFFQPHVRELRRYLVKNAEKPITRPEAVPASDRLVRLDHNQPEYLATIDAIAVAESAAVASNEILPEDRERIKFELDAGILLLKASSARIDAIEAVLIRALRWLSSNFAGAALGIAAEHALQVVLKLIGG
ncbi:hypothetical protein EN851_31465 [Mesorhizobium sp. M8A.F.Ca.ET.208.01.1.1]|uniref:hypothetical protein n=1 Tax=unclassified Mesorhizobium TaxID=325217 RepID=UPI000FCC7618|nr:MULTISPECIES: hypothetical protein [unclassified Mesorhizobium]RUW52406.1 hypothetical protein EOA36_12535 [Mesorhizobium sp. M8A.F.Ca.ET.021.01.1.1]TGQ86243.1 hypothetical protein EN851_31465 [Mesorhizobium sp. M8A.F.Ca.ET.208.01.1.1]TGT47778.1 hypothetical protein EN810_31360 [Mesorhizobium sp. M8A.F.Ca.ET.167.01.1.1]